MRQLILAVAMLFPCVTFGHANHHWLQLPDFETVYAPERVVAIPNGQVVAMPSGDIDLLWIEGRCVAPRDADLSLRVREIIVAPGGTLDMGTPSDPVLGSVTITFADGGFNANDPTQWGHGLLVFGDWNACGKQKAAWSEGSGTGESIPLSANALKAIGPLFVDKSNTITFQSENPAGTRGHIIVTDESEATIENVSLIGLGRTKPEPLSSTNFVGRYPLHFHHSMGANRSVKNVVCDGLDYQSKWGIVVHHSSWVSIAGCVATRFGGAGFVTEDGSEVGNTFNGNLAYGNKFVRRQFPVDVNEGFTGAGFWFKSMVQFIDDNVAVDNSIGFQSAVTAPDVRGLPNPGERTSVPQMAYQSSPGGVMDGIVTVFQTNLSGKRNRFIGNRFSGFDCWGSVPQAFTFTSPFWSLYALPCQWEDCLFAWNGMEFSGGQQVIHAFTQSCMLYTNCDFICSGGVGSVSSIDYHRVLYFDGCVFDGMKTGAMTGRGAIFEGNTFNCKVGILADRLSAQGWPFGLTIGENVYSDTPIAYSGTDLTIDDIKPHEVTLATVYDNVAAYRAGIVGKTPDQNAAEIERLRGEIAALEQSINTMTAQLADLRAQLMALELESQGN